MSANTKPKVEEEFIDVDLSVTKKKKIRINGDNSKIIELNTSDLNILERLSKQYPVLQECMEEVKALSTKDTDTDEGVYKMAEEFARINQKLCDGVDAIFDSPVSAVCCDSGSMYDPFNGSFRYEYIIDTLTKLYEDNINAEYKKMKNRVENKANKYKGK